MYQPEVTFKVPHKTPLAGQELIGSFDSQLDDTLRVDREDANDMTSWAEATVPEEPSVLCCSLFAAHQLFSQSIDKARLFGLKKFIASPQRGQ